MKKGISILLAILFCLNLFAQTKPSKGDGSKKNPYQISNAQELLWFAKKASGTLEGESWQYNASAILTEDIDMKEICGEGIGNWEPIGIEKEPYKGTFLGNGHSISNLYIKDTSDNSQLQRPELGLFGVVDYGKISNLNISGNIYSTNECKYIGAIAACVENAIIDSCTSSVNIVNIVNKRYYSYRNAYFGGIVGYLRWGGISNCTFSGSIDIPYGNEYEVGGIVGIADQLKNLSNCRNEGQIKVGENIELGGIVGYLEYTTIDNCHNISNLEAKSICGGIIGSCAGDTKIINCDNTGEIQGYKAGGIVGIGTTPSVESCHNEGAIRSTIAGGIAGYLSSNSTSYKSAISNCYNNGIISGLENSGGIAGYLKNAIVKECVNNGNINNDYINIDFIFSYSVGGIVGFSEFSTIEKCYNKGTIESNDSKDVYKYYGGIVGELENTTIRYCFNKGDISTIPLKGYNIAGGICGKADHLNLRYCYSISNISCAIAGGLIGDLNSWSNINHSYSYGNLNYHQIPSSGVIGYDQHHPNTEVGDLYYHDSKIDTIAEGQTFKSMEAFKAGEVCYLLNGSDSIPTFFQTIGIDDYPIFTGNDIIVKDDKGYHNEMLIPCVHDSIVDTVAADCFHNGYFVCGICSKKIIDEKSKPEHHLINEITSEPTCTKKGVLTTNCSFCDFFHIDSIQVIAHDTIKQVVTNPTCTKIGYSKAQCSMCGLFHYYCDTVAALGHDTVKTIAAPTCTKIGYSKAQCSMCGKLHYYCDTVPALGHDNVKVHYDKTCHAASRTDIRCKACGLSTMGVAEEAPTMEHDYVNDICTVCGLPRSEKPESKDGYFLIKNARELLWFSEYVYAGNTKVNAKLTADIDLSEVCGDKIKKNWLPIGDIDKKEWAFAGEFDGQGHTISNLFFNNKYITKDSLCYRHPEFDGDDIGLFGGNSGLIKNVKLKGLSITSVRYVGGISANNYGTITDCSIERSTLNTEDTYLGGICGFNKGKINRCVSSAEVSTSGTNAVIGGLVGRSEDTISHCLSFASVLARNTSKNNYLGGIVGHALEIVYNCFSASKITWFNSNFSYISVGSGEGSGYTSYYTADKKNPYWQGGTYLTKTEVQTGIACYQLNIDKNLKEPVWAQTLGVDNYPHLKTDDPNEKYVYKYFERNCPCTEEIEKYGNCSFDSIPDGFAHLVTYPNHLNEDDDPEKYDCCGLYTEEYLSQYSDKDFEIKSIEDLIKFRDVVKNGGKKINATLLADIDLSEICGNSKGSWIPISSYDGIFKGNGHSIENLYINDTKSEDYQALFSVITGEIRDLRVTGSVLGLYSCSGICCSCYGTISGCINEVNTSSNKNKSSGGIYYSLVEGSIKNCLNIGSTLSNGTIYKRTKLIKFISKNQTSYNDISYGKKDISLQYDVVDRDGDLYILTGDTLSPELMCLKLNSHEIGWGLTEKDGIKTAVPAAFASKLIYPSGLVTCPLNKTYSEYSDTIVSTVHYRYPEHIDADHDGVYDCCGYHFAFLETYNNGVFEICNAKQMKAFADEVNAGRFIDANVKLVSDIDLSEVCNETIGNWTPIYHFAGKFDGQHHKISGLYINKNGDLPEEWDVDMYSGLGLFSGNYGEITRVGIAKNCVIKSDNLCIGAVCAVNHGLVSYCYNEAAVESKHGIAGGVVGFVEGANVVSCYNVGQISGDKVAGIIGCNYCSAVSNCHNYGPIQRETSNYGDNDISHLLECDNLVDNYILSNTICDTVIDSYDKIMKMVYTSEIAFADGSVCYALNKNQDSTVWYQTLNVDPYPVLDPTHGKVLYDEEKGIYYNYPDIEYSEVHEIKDEKQTASLLTFVVNRQVIVFGVDSFRIINMFGHDVTALNGSLADGVYVVVADGNVAKVVVK